MERHRSARQLKHKQASRERIARSAVIAADSARPTAAAVRMHPAYVAPAPAESGDFVRSQSMFRLLRHKGRHWVLLIGWVDAALLVGAVGIAMQVRYAADASSYAASAGHLFWRAALFAAALVLSMFALGLYQLQSRETPIGMLVREAVGFVLGTLLLVVVYYALPQAYIGRGVLGLALAFGFAGVALWRVLVGNLLDAEVLKRRIVVLGAGHGAAFVAEWMHRRRDWQTFTVVGFIPVEGEAVRIPAERLAGLRGAALHEWATARQIDEVVVAPDDRRGTLPMQDLLECKQRGIEVTDLVRFLERESGRVKLTAAPSWLVFSEGFHASPLRCAVKRLFGCGQRAAGPALRMAADVAHRARDPHRVRPRPAGAVLPGSRRRARPRVPPLQVPQHAH